MARWGLRWKSLLVLILAGVIASFIALTLGWYVVAEGRQYSAKTYSENYTELNYQKILAPMSRELALAKRLAQLGTVETWFADPENQVNKDAALYDINAFKQAFEDGAIFFATDKDLAYYYYDEHLPVDGDPQYHLDANVEANKWYFLTRNQTAPYNINVDLNEQLHKTKIWINVLVKHQGEFLGLAGTGFELGRFIESFTSSPQPGVQPFVINADTLKIEAHSNSGLVSIGGMGSAREDGITIMGLVEDAEPLQRAIAQAKSGTEVVTLRTRISGEPYVLSMRYMPDLNWLVATSVNLNEVRLLNTDLIMAVGIVFAVLLMVVLILFGFAVDRLVLQPLRQLQQSAKAISQGSYEVRLPVKYDDEIGDLSRTFNTMAQQVASHTAELESRVKARTQELEQSNAQIKEANRKIGDSIDYASLIQKAILPDRQMQQFLGEHHSVVWRPRDIVGGDFYVFHTNSEGCLLGIVDCAGHGVPGALMTMLMRAAIDKAVNELGISDPAKLLYSIDQTVRSMLHEENVSNQVATNADVGLVYIHQEGDTLRFSGAKIALYASDGQVVEKHQGCRRAIGDRKVGEYMNQDLPLSGWTYYMTTDGYLDQAGGDKQFGFGNKRFESLLLENAQRPLSQQTARFAEALDDYMGDLPQRDDITLLSFRFEH
ncbi:biofilm regulation protein phosphatase SiaA [Marinomonas communis]|uniref:biofilm regulation protein phosphatase SiaA n=1 Tax=Marinomonas communis TaxID=28254 RepID=UPI0010037953|nr:biofilm regulation protein phosphatase SiaA [Marinomonas communis]MCC4275321.1 biofilm regulation protein phosphatase SiaA [Marinomonas communis]RUM56088.1 MAG: histidine kinase [Marinomonas sp.]